jgi:hypothetical protein
MTHRIKNARLTPKGREEMVRAVVRSTAIRKREALLPSSMRQCAAFNAFGVVVDRVLTDMDGDTQSAGPKEMGR